MIHEFEGNCRDLIEILFRNLPGGTEENNSRPQSWYPVPLAEIRTSTSRIQESSKSSNTVQSVKCQQTIRKNMSLPSSGPKNYPSKKQVVLRHCIQEDNPL
jgi:hypothetical protein